MSRKHSSFPLILAAMLVPAGTLVFSIPQQTASFESDVRPIIKKYCLPCHLADSENPSGLAMDNYELLRKGGENGDPVVPGQPEESLLYLKLQSPPPFGKQMPRNRSAIREEELRVIRKWIEQGGKQE